MLEDKNLVEAYQHIYEVLSDFEFRTLPLGTSAFKCAIKKTLLLSEKTTSMSSTQPSKRRIFFSTHKDLNKIRTIQIRKMNHRKLVFSFKDSFCPKDTNPCT